MAGTHARYSPSGASGWMRCADWSSDPKGSKFANWGTAAHDVAARCLVGDIHAVEFLGLTINVEGELYGVDDDMVECIQQYIDYVRSIPGERYVEQRLPISTITGEADAHGTADCVILAGDELIVIDLKTGRGVKVDADYNEQLQIYALAAMEQFAMLYDFTNVRMVIVQPRLGHVSEFVQSVEGLTEFGLRVKPATEVVPGEKQCRWCSKKGTCPALKAQSLTTFESIQPPEDADDVVLAKTLAKVDLIEDWCRAVRAEAERRLLDGKTLPGWKLVQGRAGARAWTDEQTVEDMLKAMRLRQDEMYQFKLKSPTQLEKDFKDQPKRWAKLQEHIGKKEGSPTVVPSTDKRQALTPGVCSSEFTPITETA